jgi:hypothetical protein
MENFNDLPEGSLAEFQHEFGNATTVLYSVLQRRHLENPKDPDFVKMSQALERMIKQYHKTFATRVNENTLR